MKQAKSRAQKSRVNAPYSLTPAKLACLKPVLDSHLLSKSSLEGLRAHPDPLWVASELKEPVSSLACALFAYGNASLIVKFLRSIDFEILKQSEAEIRQYFGLHKYRFQSTKDVEEIFISLARLQRDWDIEDILSVPIREGFGIEFGISKLISCIYSLNNYRSSGYEFFFGREFDKTPSSPLKRYNMYLRWMVRDSDIDLGLFTKLSPSLLLLPLDVHTHRISLALGLGKRKSYDFGSVLEITQNLRLLDAKDPIKYDFALYRIGQLGELNSVLDFLQ